MKPLGKPPFTCLITEGKLTAETYGHERSLAIDTISQAVRDGVKLIQIRERHLVGRLLFEFASDVVSALRATDALVIVNDRSDIAAACGADGVHLRETSLDPDVVRRVVGKDFVIGVSTHNADGAIAASEAGADFALFGPIFDSPGKGAPQGIEELRSVCFAVGSFPVLALGGVDSENALRALDAGASGVAGIRSMHDPRKRRAMIAAINAWSAGVR